MLPTRHEPERIVEARLDQYPHVENCRRCTVQTECGKVFSGIVSLTGEATDYRSYEPDGDVSDLIDRNIEATSGEDLEDK